jgi:hypothetical protein
MTLAYGEELIEVVIRKLDDGTWQSMLTANLPGGRGDIIRRTDGYYKTAEAAIRGLLEENG